MGRDRIGPASGVAEEIDRYLYDHPGASDNLIGVVTWWLNRDANQETMDVVEAALLELVAMGVVERRALPDGGAIYRRSGRH